MPSNSTIKLHLGCGQDYWPGYVNIDIDPKSKADKIMTYLEIDSVYALDTVEEIVLIHSFNYLYLWDARLFLEKAFKLLKPNGKLIIETVNIEKSAKRMLAGINSGDFADYLEGIRGIFAFGLDTLQKQERYQPYVFGWSGWHLKQELERAGFGEVDTLSPQTHAVWRDMRIEASKLPVSANLKNLGSTLLAKSTTNYKGRVLFVLDSRMGHITIFIRGLIYKELFLKNNWKVEYVDIHQVSEDEVVRLSADFDVVYLLKVPYLSLVRKLKRRSNATVIFDLTDALWKPVHRKAGWQDLEKILKKVDVVFSENEWICEYGRKFNSRVYSIPPCTQVEIFDQYRDKIQHHSEDRIVVGWIGSTGTVSALSAIRMPLEHLFERYPNLELRILGCTDPSLLPKFDYVRCSVIGNYTEDEMIVEALNMDIGLFPPPFDLEDYRVRGALKGLIYMTAGLPSVCQNDGDIARIIQDGINGMLASNDQEWEEKIEILIKNPELRRVMGQKALETVREEHSLQHVFAQLESALLDVIKTIKPGTGWRQF